MNKKVLAIVGARPQFIKHYAFEIEAIKCFDLITVHTGQHYDENMSQVFFDQLGMRKPNYLLSLGGGGHGEQTGKMMIELEKIVLAEKPEAIVVYGDTNSTLAGALVASKLHIKLVHIEAGLRSFNKQMPEEVNRILTDHISDLLLVPSQTSVDNLSNEGITKGVYIVGDIMKDMIRIAKEKDILKLKQGDRKYFYVTLHRPYNVDDHERLAYILDQLGNLKKEVIFSVHPRTIKKIDEYRIKLKENIRLIDPQPYFENLSYLHNSEGLITDSGGMQKEAYWLGKRCITIRTETEWTETLIGEANQLLFEDLSTLDTRLRNKVSFDNVLYGNGYAARSIINEMKTIEKV
ncbi:UNVERIFIED_CONTAM: hypothetical protein GTU68_027201 [Idotea baltica]|nr:hypothetical protein [Idotea baltica]